MNFGLTEEQRLLKSTLHRFVDEKCPTTRVRSIMEGDTGHDLALWQELAALGVMGLVVPEAVGGSGLELLDLALAAEELGYGAIPGPFLGNAIAAVALVAAQDDDDLLGRLATGEAVLSVAIGEAGANWDPGRLSTAVTDGRLNGEKWFVPHADSADALLVAARDDSGPGLWLVERHAPGLEISSLRSVDATRRVHTVRLHDTPARPIAGGSETLDRALDAGAVLVAADAFGGSQRCLDMAAGYALEREQFGQIIGAFQAVKHQIASLACELEPSLSLWWYAAHAFDRVPEEGPRLASMAKALLTDLFDRATRESTELHGGIGFTWEFDLHLWFRRAIFDRGFLGDAAYHRERAARLGGW